MANAFEQILFVKQNKRFREIEEIALQVSLLYSGNPMIRDGIFTVVWNFARKNDIPIEILRYPFHDDELWAFAFLKKGTIFVCINSGLSVCKQIFATAHELYHIYCFATDTDQNTIRNGSLLDEKTVDTVEGKLEELEANAFAGLLLMPSKAVRNQMEILGIHARRVTVDDVLSLMEIFAVPYKACVLRLYECGMLSLEQAQSLYETPWKEVADRVFLTGKAKRWLLHGEGTEVFGTLLEDYSFNVENGFLTETREASDAKYIASLKERYHLEEVGI